MLNINLGQAPAKPIKTISGLYLGKAVRRYTKRRRAQDAAGWIRGEVAIVTPTIKLAAAVFGVSAPVVRAQLDRCAKHHANGNSGDSYPISDDALDRLVTAIGADRVLAAIDRATQPQLPLAAAE